MLLPFDLWLLSQLPLAALSPEPLPVTAAEERAVRQACLFGLTDKRRLDGVVERREWERRNGKAVA